MGKCIVMSMEGWRNPAQLCADAGEGRRTQHSQGMQGEGIGCPMGAYNQTAEPRKQRTNRAYLIAC